MNQDNSNFGQNPNNISQLLAQVELLKAENEKLLRELEDVKQERDRYKINLKALLAVQSKSQDSFEKITQEQKKLDIRLGQVFSSQSAITQTVEELGIRLQKLEEVFKQSVEERKLFISKVDEIFPSINAIRNQIETLEVSKEERFAKIEDRIENFRETIKYQQWRLEIYDKGFNRSSPSEEETSIDNQTGEAKGLGEPNDQQEFELIEHYNINPVALRDEAVEVSLTEDSINQFRLGSNSVFFEKKGRGSYWILLQNQRSFLVPKPDLNINDHNEQVIRNLFDCRNYHNSHSKQFRLVYPASVFSVGSSDEKWQFRERGILSFV